MRRFVKSTEPEAHEEISDAPAVAFGALLWRVVLVGALVATMYTAWTPLGIFPGEIFSGIGQLFEEQNSDPAIAVPNPTPRPRPRIGIVAGHWGNDSGAVCSDGLTEDQVNLEIATLVKEKLTAEGFDVDLLREFDETLNGYTALLLVSIHADSCQFIDLNATGFKVAASWANPRPEKASRLVACIHSRYIQTTGLPFHAGSITNDMTSYHAFDEINPETTAVIIETGFLNLDREILTQRQEVVADGIVQGILCYIYNEDASLPSSQ